MEIMSDINNQLDETEVLKLADELREALEELDSNNDGNIDPPELILTKP